ncbi:hypothetical protein M8494_10160 [Serratia ureilytica]
MPRHCRHPTFGLQTFYRPMLGSTYVDKILARAGQVEIRTGVTVLAIQAGRRADHHGSPRRQHLGSAQRVIPRPACERRAIRAW